MTTLSQSFSTATELHGLLNQASKEALACAEWQTSLELNELALQVAVIAAAIHEQQFKTPKQKVENN